MMHSDINTHKYIIQFKGPLLENELENLVKELNNALTLNGFQKFGDDTIIGEVRHTKSYQHVLGNSNLEVILKICKKSSVYQILKRQDGISIENDLNLTKKDCDKISKFVEGKYPEHDLSLLEWEESPYPLWGMIWRKKIAASLQKIVEEVAEEKIKEYKKYSEEK